MIINLIIENLNTNSSENICLNLYDTSNSEFQGITIIGKGNLILAMTLSVYILVALYSVVFAFRRLNRDGVSKEIRMMFIKKHFLYVAVFIVIWVI